MSVIIGVGMRDEELQAFLDGVRANDAAHARVRQRWLRQQAAEEATLGDMLRAVVGQPRSVILRLANARVHRGWLRAVGDDHCCLQTPDRQVVYVAQSAITTVRFQKQPLADDRSQPPVRDSARLVDALSWLVESRPHVVVGLRGHSEPLRGQLEAVGQDLVLIRAGDATYVPLVAITDIAASRSDQESGLGRLGSG